MNENLHKQIASFFSSVSNYMKNEYKSRYYKYYNSDRHIDKMIEITGKYYMGGASVPDVAGVIVDYMKKLGV